MRYAIREDLIWLIENGKTVGQSDTWHCRHHPGVKIEQVMRPRSLWLYPMAHAGPGKVMPVLHLYCPHCSPERHRANSDGEGIYTIQLIQVDELLLPATEPESLLQLFNIPKVIVKG